MAGKLSYKELEQKIKELEKKAFECKKAEDALKLFSHSFEYSIDGLIVGNTENRITYVNEAFAKMFGYAREELVGKEIALIYPDDQTPLLKEVLKITMEGGWTGELIGKKKDGTRFPVSVSSSRVLDDQGNVIAHMASHRDITQQKQTSEALRESEEKWRSLIETAPCVILMVQRDGTIQFLNRTTGNYTPESRIGTKVWDHVPPDHHSVMKKAIDHVFQTGSPISYEILGTGREGPASAWYMTQLGPIIRDRQVVAVTMASIDITVTKKAYEALRESEEKYRTLFENSKDAISITTRDGKYIAFNQSFLDLFGYTEEDMINVRAKDKYIDPNDRVTFKQKVEEEGSVRDLEATLKKKDGTKIYALLTSSLWLAHDGSILGYQGIIRDITKQKLAEETLRGSEEKWRSVFKQSKDPIAITTRNGEYVDGNQSFLDLFGYTEEEIKKSNSTERYAHPDDRIRFTKEVEEKGSVKDYELILRKTNGEEMITLCNATLRQAHDGSILGYQSTIRDITQQKQAVEALRASEEKWRSLAETAPCVILMVQRDGTIQFLNRPVGNFTPGNVIGTKVWDYVPPDHHSVMRKAIEHVFQTGLPIGYEVLGAGPEGPASAWYMTQLGPILKDGQVAAATMVSTDITEIKKVHDELRESEAQKKAILDSSINRIRLVDTDMRIIWANKTTTRELHIAPEYIVGKFCYQVFVGRDTPCPKCPSKKALTSGKIEHAILHEHDTKCFEGETHWDSYSVPLKNESGDIESLIQISRNITEQVGAEKALRKSEEKYRTILESIEEGYYEIDMAGNFTFFNDSICKMFGYSRDELLGMNNREYEDIKTAKKAYKVFNKVYKTGKPKNMVDVEIIRKNGGRRNIETSVSLIKDSQGNATGFRGILRDVTDRKRAERAMKKREAELASVNKQLIETNKALSVLAKNLDITQKESEKRVIQRIRRYIIPIIEKLRQDKNIERYRADFDLLTSCIRDLTSDLADDIKIALALSTTELRVASLIRNGMSNQEIAKHLYITEATVKTHRKNIRRKLDLHNSGINLKAYMKSELDQE